MTMFRVTSGASEPAAYAISALEEFNLQPTGVGKSVAYGVFDFGGGTTDFDFGMEEIPEDGRRKFVIHRFGAGGDSYLGGENILDLLAYEVYLDNLELMRSMHIPFVLPPTCKRFAGTETLVFASEDASQQAYMNSKCLAREMRCIWERRDGYNNKFAQPLGITLFSTQKQDNSDKQQLSIKVEVPKLEQVIEKRIRHGVENFFTAMMHAFDGRPVRPIHIFLAGNSCKSVVVKTIFDEYIKKYESDFAASIHESTGQEKDTSGTFILHPPLGMTWDDYTKISDEKRAEIQKMVSVIAAVANNNTEPTDNSDIIDPTSASDGEVDNGSNVQAYVVDHDYLLDGEETEKSSNLQAAKESKIVQLSTGIARDFDCQRTGKTGVAFGLLRTRIGGRDVKIIDEDAEGNEIPFCYFLGNIDRDNHFRVRIGMEVPYGQWVWFAYADEPEFELYYTKEPNSLKGEFSESDVERERCLFDKDACSDDDEVGVYIRKVKPDTVEYAIGRKEDFETGNLQGKPYVKQLKG